MKKRATINYQAKLTWKDVFDDFSIRFPNISKRALRWEPLDVEKIRIYFPNNVKATYDYRLKILEGYRFTNS